MTPPPVTFACFLSDVRIEPAALENTRRDGAEHAAGQRGDREGNPGTAGDPLVACVGERAARATGCSTSRSIIAIPAGGGRDWNTAPEHPGARWSGPYDAGNGISRARAEWPCLAQVPASRCRH